MKHRNASPVALVEDGCVCLGVRLAALGGEREKGRALLVEGEEELRAKREI